MGNTESISEITNEENYKTILTSNSTYENIVKNTYNKTLKSFTDASKNFVQRTKGTQDMDLSDLHLEGVDGAVIEQVMQYTVQMTAEDATTISKKVTDDFKTILADQVTTQLDNSALQDLMTNLELVKTEDNEHFINIFKPRRMEHLEDKKTTTNTSKNVDTTLTTNVKTKLQSIMNTIINDEYKADLSARLEQSTTTSQSLLAQNLTMLNSKNITISQKMYTDVIFKAEFKTEQIEDLLSVIGIQRDTSTSTTASNSSELTASTAVSQSEAYTTKGPIGQVTDTLGHIVDAVGDVAKVGLETVGDVANNALSTIAEVSETASTAIVLPAIIAVVVVILIVGIVALNVWKDGGKDIAAKAADKAINKYMGGSKRRTARYTETISDTLSLTDLMK